MPDRRRHRGRHPDDLALFGPEQLPALRRAVHEYSWLLGRGYAPVAALKLVGDRHQLALRQRQAVARSACSDAARERRAARRSAFEALAGRTLSVDGFNACITLEAALSGGAVLVGRDGAHRDLASVHGTYRRVLETRAALDLALGALAAARPAGVRWLFDRPVSNSGSLAALVRERIEHVAGAGALASFVRWSVDVIDAPDRALIAAEVAVSCDGGVIDQAPAWFDLPGYVIAESVREAWVVELGLE